MSNRNFVRPLLAAAVFAAGPAHAEREGPEIKLLEDVDAAGKKVASVLDEFDRAQLDLAVVQADIDHATALRDEAVRKFGPGSPDSMAQEKAISDAKFQLRKTAGEKVLPVLKMLAEAKQDARAKRERMMAEQGGFKRTFGAWMTRRRGEPAVHLLVLERATREMEDAAFELHRRALLGNIASILASIRHSLETAGKLVKGEGDEYERAVDEALSGRARGADEPADEYEKLQRASRQ